jgi:hypothetical protein
VVGYTKLNLAKISWFVWSVRVSFKKTIIFFLLSSLVTRVGSFQGGICMFNVCFVLVEILQPSAKVVEQQNDIAIISLAQYYRVLTALFESTAFAHRLTLLSDISTM